MKALALVPPPPFVPAPLTITTGFAPVVFAPVVQVICVLPVVTGFVQGTPPIETVLPEKPPAWVWPTVGAVTSPFGWRELNGGKFHNGIDIANRQGTPINAVRRGTVTEAGWCSGFGYCVKMNHEGGFTSTYGHMMAQPSVVVGQWVEAGEMIGLMGTTYDVAGGGYSTGPHLHLTLKLDGLAVDPLRWLAPGR